MSLFQNARLAGGFQFMKIKTKRLCNPSQLLTSLPIHRLHRHFCLQLLVHAETIKTQWLTQSKHPLSLRTLLSSTEKQLQRKTQAVLRISTYVQRQPSSSPSLTCAWISINAPPVQQSNSFVRAVQNPRSVSLPKAMRPS